MSSANEFNLDAYIEKLQKHDERMKSCLSIIMRHANEARIASNAVAVKWAQIDAEIREALEPENPDVVS